VTRQELDLLELTAGDAAEARTWASEMVRRDPGLPLPQAIPGLHTERNNLPFSTAAAASQSSMVCFTQRHQ